MYVSCNSVLVWLRISELVLAQPQNRLECLSCGKIAKPQDCLFKRLCPPDEYCFTEHYITAEGHVFYNLGCRPTSICESGQMTSVVGRREIPNEAVVVCEQCCNGKYCNQHLCGGIDPPAPKCLSCTNMHNPSFCEHLQLCEPHESCSIQERLTPDFNLVYDLGCTDNVICDALTSQLVPGGLCVNCCNSSLCNDECIVPLPTTTPPPTTTPTTPTPPPTTTPAILKQICATMPPDVTLPTPQVSSSVLRQLGCGSPEDIVFVVDESNHVKNDMEKTFQAFADNYMLTLKLGPSAGRVGYTVYGSNPHDVIELTEGDDVNKVDAMLRNFTVDSDRDNERSDLAKALHHVNSKYFAGNKGRPGARKVVVVLSASDPIHTDQAVREAKDLRNSGVEVVVALVDNHLDSQTWHQIASSPADQYLLDTKDFKSLINEMENLLLSRCLPVGVVPTFPTIVCGGSSLLSQLGCGAKEDILVIMDRSGSIRDDDWPKMVNFTKGLVNIFNVSPNASRMGVLSFSRDMTENIPLTSFSNKADLLNAIDNTVGQLGTDGSTNTNLALDRARAIFSTQGRPDSIKVVVIMTDGGSDTKLETLSSAIRLHLDDVQIFVIGIGSDVDLKEQAILATDPDNFHMLSVIDQNSLLFYLDLLAVQRCLENATTAPPVSSSTQNSAGPVSMTTAHMATAPMTTTFMTTPMTTTLMTTTPMTTTPMTTTPMATDTLATATAPAASMETATMAASSSAGTTVVTMPPALGTTTAAPASAGPSSTGPIMIGSTTAGPTAAVTATAAPLATAPTTPEAITTSSGPFMVDSTTAAPVSCGPTTTGPMTAESSTPAPIVVGASSSGPSVMDTTTSAPMFSGPITTGPMATESSTPGPIMIDVSSSSSGPSAMDSTTPAPLTAAQSGTGAGASGPTAVDPITAYQETAGTSTVGPSAPGAVTTDSTTSGPPAVLTSASGPVTTVPPAAGITSDVNVSTTADPFDAVCLPVSPGVLLPPEEVTRSVLARLGCGAKEDIIFLVDMAGHVTDEHEALLQAFIDNIVLAVNMSDTSARVGYTGYASTFHDVITLPHGNNLTYVDGVLRSFFTNFSRQNDTANLGNALHHLYNKYFSRGAIRPGARPVVVILPHLDQFQDPIHPGLAVHWAQNLTALGVDIVVALVRTSFYSDKVWRKVASSPDHFLSAASFEDLVRLLEDLLLTRCPGEPEAVPPSRLCAERNTLTDVGCSKQNDVMLVLDRSADVTDDDWFKISGFVGKLLAEIRRTAGSNTRAGVISYASDVKENVPLTDVGTTSDFLPRTMLSLQGERPGGDNRVDLALTRVQEVLKTNGRPGVEKVAVWVTGGPSQQKLMTFSAAARLRSSGVGVFSLGVGPKVDLKELAVVASDPDVTHMMAARDSDALHEYFDLLTSTRCQAVPTP